MNQLQEILLVVFAAYVVCKGTLLWMANKNFQELAEKAKQKQAIKRMQERSMIPEGWKGML